VDGVAKALMRPATDQDEDENEDYRVSCRLRPYHNVGVHSEIGNRDTLILGNGARNSKGNDAEKEDGKDSEP
jgi:hypothetical protein